MKSNLPKLEVMDDNSIYSSGDVTKRDVFDLNFTSDQTITALRLEVLTDDRLPGQGPGRCYYEGRKGTFFSAKLTSKHQMVQKSNLQNLLQPVEMAQIR